MRSEKSDHIGSGRVKTNTGPKTDRQTDRQLESTSDQLQISLSVSHQWYIIQYGEFGNR